MNEETGNVSSNFLLKSVEYVLISLSHQLISDNSKSVSCLNRGRSPLAQKSCYCSIHFFYYLEGSYTVLKQYDILHGE